MPGITLDSIGYDAHSIKIADADGDILAIDASGKISAVVEATDLDIRDLSHSQDSVKVGDGTEFLAIDTDGAAFVRDADANTKLAAIETAVELIDDVVYTDNGAFVDGSSKGALVFGVDGSNTMQPLKMNAAGELVVSASIDDIAEAFVVTKVTVTTTATQLKASPLANRRFVTIQNLGTRDIYVGDGSATTNDLLVPAKSSATYNWGVGVDVYAITATGTSDIRFMEAA